MARLWRVIPSLAALLALSLVGCTVRRASRTTLPPTPAPPTVLRSVSPLPTATPVQSRFTSASPSATPITTTTLTPTARATVPAPPPVPTGMANPASAPPSLPPVATTGVTYPEGWNLVAGPQGTVITGNEGPMYTLRASDTGYEVVPSGTPLQEGAAYWVYFPQPETETLPSATLEPITVPLLQNGFVLIGDPGNAPLFFIGGQQLFYSYDPRSGYAQTTSILPGQGLWVYSFVAGSLMLRGPTR